MHDVRTAVDAFPKETLLEAPQGKKQRRKGRNHREWRRKKRRQKTAHGEVDEYPAAEDYESRERSRSSGESGRSGRGSARQSRRRRSIQSTPRAAAVEEYKPKKEYQLNAFTSTQKYRPTVSFLAQLKERRQNRGVGGAHNTLTGLLSPAKPKDFTTLVQGKGLSRELSYRKTQGVADQVQSNVLRQQMTRQHKLWQQTGVLKPLKGNSIHNQSNLTLIANNFLSITNKTIVFANRDGEVTL